MDASKSENKIPSRAFAFSLFEVVGALFG